jgi:hypothetical protein
MPKYVIETVQVVKRSYYVEVDDVSYAHNSIAMGELDQFESNFLTEDITSTTAVDEWPTATSKFFNAATHVFDEDTGEWDPVARWDLVNKSC